MGYLTSFRTPLDKLTLPQKHPKRWVYHSAPILASKSLPRTPCLLAQVWTVFQLMSPPVPASLGLQYRRTSAYVGDAKFIANRRLTCQTWTTNGVPAYCYRFNAIPAGQQYVAHVQEIPFVFNSIQGYGYRTPPFQNKSQSYIDLARFMTISWASFVHDLDPNSFRASNASVAGRRRGGRCRM